MRSSLYATLLAALLASPSARGQSLPAFPGAEGPGSDATGGRGGDVYHVTNLEFDLNGVVPGSLKYGINNAPAAGRTIVFDVGGTIYQPGGGAGWWFRSGKSNITIAGQTAPGPGITIAGVGSKWTGDNVILRNITVRPNQDPVNPTNYTYDAFGLQLTNSIVDHVTGSWYTDEGISQTDAGANATIQYALIDEGLNYNSHSYGSIISTEVDGTEYAFHHNLYAQNNSRMPRLGSEIGTIGVVTNFSNNVLYNWINRAGYSGTDQPSSTNFLGNYYIKGNNNGSTLFTGGDTATNLVTKIYQSGNVYDSNKNGIADGAPVTNSNFAGSKLLVPSAFDVADSVVLETADAARRRVLDYGGANWANRNSIEQRIVQAVRNGTGQLINDLSSGVQATEWATVLAQRAIGGVAPFSRDASWDTDGDGIPGFWELEHGLDPDEPNVNTDFDSDGYTDLEEYINELSEWPAPGVLQFRGGAGDQRFARIQNWEVSGQQVNIAGRGLVTPTTNWQPSRLDTAAIQSGSVVVDAVGQHAGVLQVAPGASDSATLTVSEGWLRVEDSLQIATGGGTGAVDLTGGALQVGRITKGPGGSLNITGGALQADQIAFDLINQGGVILPGQTLGVTEVLGDAVLQSGVLAIDLLAPSVGGLLAVEGDLTLGGDLAVAPVAGYSPRIGDAWVIATASAFHGGFQRVTPGYSVSQSGGSLLLSVISLAGDFNGDGVVDLADFTVWRDGLGTTYTAADYSLWSANYGVSGAASAAAAPEPPAMLALASIAMCGVTSVRRKR